MKLVSGRRYLIAMVCPGWLKAEMRSAEYYAIPNPSWLVDGYGWQPEEYIIFVAEYPEAPLIEIRSRAASGTNGGG